MSRGSTRLIADNELWSSEQGDELTADRGGQRWLYGRGGRERALESHAGNLNHSLYAGIC